MRFESQFSRMNCHLGTCIFRDVFDRIEFGALGRQGHEGDVGGYFEGCRAMPSGLIEQQHGMCARRDMEGDLFEVHAHRLAVAPGHDDACGLALSRADCAEDPRGGPTLVLRRTRAGATLCPAAGEFGLLTDARLVLPPYLDWRVGRQAGCYRRQLVCEVFLKAGMASSF